MKRRSWWGEWSARWALKAGVDHVGFLRGALGSHGRFGAGGSQVCTLE